MTRPGHFFGRLLAAAVVLLAPLVALHAWTLYQQNAQAEAAAYRAVSSRALDKTTQIQALLVRTRTLLEVIADRTDIALLDPQRCAGMLEGLASLDPLYVNIGVVDAQGDVVCAALLPRGQPARSLAETAWFRAAMASDAPVLSPPLQAPFARRMVAALSVPLRGPTGVRIGAVGATIDLVRLAERNFGPGLPPGASLTLVDANDTVMTRFPDPERWIGRPTPATVRAARRESPHGVIVAPGADGVVRAYATVDVGIHGLRLAAGIPTSYVFSAPRTALLRGLLVGGATLLLAAALALGFARTLSRPLQSLARTAKHWAAGARGARADETLPGEFRALAHEFNAMIDAREASEAQLVESERRYAAMLDGVDLLAITVALDGRLLYANDALARLTGWSVEDLLQGDWTRLVLPEHATDIFAGLRVTAAREVPVPPRQDGVLLTRDGRRRRIRWANAPLRSAAGELLGITSIGEDVTDREEAEAARQASARAEAANQAKTAFLAHMSHELRTPLNAVLGFSQLLQMETADRLDDAQRHRLELIYLAGLQLRALIDDVLDVSRIESGQLAVQPDTVALGPLVDEVLRLSAPAAQAAKVALAWDGPPPDETLRTDPVRLRQVLLNLVSNGIKYNRPGGHVHLSHRVVGDRLEIDVADDGLGMTPEQLAQLFEPFNRLGREHGPVAGTGIGMTLSRQIARLLGGDLAVVSTPALGTRVTVTLASAVVAKAPPAGAAPAATVARAIPTEGGRPASADRATGAAQDAGQPTGTVLYIEDNAANTLIVQELLKPWPGVGLLVAADGRSGIARAREAVPDVVLLDMRLPDMHGLEVLAALRTDPRTAAIPVVSLSASAMPEEVDAARAAGATAYWTKPVDFGPFLKGMAALLGPGAA